MMPWSGISTAVLAGGLGTRLRSAVADRPKVLASVLGRPFLSHLLDPLARVGIREVVLLTGHRADQVRDILGEEYSGIRLIHSAEPMPLGTGGAIRHALPSLVSETILLFNGDSFCDVDLRAFHHFHQTLKSGVSMVLARVSDASRYGSVRITPEGRVIRFEEKSSQAGPGWINAGVYLLRRDLLEDLPTGQAISLERDLLPNWVEEGRVHGFRGAGRFLDIGTPESYAEAEAFFHATSHEEPYAGRR